MQNCAKQGNIERIYHMWTLGRYQEVRAAVNTRLQVITKMIPRFRRKFYTGALSIPQNSGKRPTLVHAGCRFTMISALNIQDPLLTKVAFVTQYEHVSTCAATVNERVAVPIEQLVLRGHALKLVRDDNAVDQAYELMDDFTAKNNRELKNERIVRFRLHADSAHICPTLDMTKDWLLVPDTTPGRNRAIYFQDGLCCDATFYNDLAQIISVSQDGDVVVVTVQMNKPSPSLVVQAEQMSEDADPDNQENNQWPTTQGQVFYMYKRFVSLGIFKRTMNGLMELDKTVSAVRQHNGEGADSAPQNLHVKPIPLFIRLINRPTAWDDEDLVSETLPWGGQSQHHSPQLDANQQAALDANTFGLQLSQRTALNKCIRKHLTVCWGPPGAGKTRYMASAICTLIQLHYCRAAENSPFTVLITASTNSAIETCLTEVAVLLSREENNDLRERIKLIKVKGRYETEKEWMTEHQIELLPPDKVTTGVFASGCVILGSTPYRLPTCSFSKKEPLQAAAAAAPFNLMCIDEASQLTIAVAALAIQYMNTRGRLIVAGDHLQVRQ